MHVIREGLGMDKVIPGKLVEEEGKRVGFGTPGHTNTQEYQRRKGVGKRLKCQQREKRCYGNQGDRLKNCSTISNMAEAR